MTGTNGKGTITKEDAERILTAFCSSYPDLTEYREVIADYHPRETHFTFQTMQRLQQYGSEGSPSWT